VGTNRTAVNETALNEGGQLTTFLAVTFAATALIAADATYDWRVDTNLLADAVISSSTNQNHAASGQPSGRATSTASGLVQKWLATDATANATVAAAYKPPDGSVSFGATGDFTADAFFVSPMESALPGTSTFTIDDAGIQYVLYGQAIFDGAGTPDNPETSSFFIADPSYLASGATDYIHYGGWDPRQLATAEMTFTPGDVKIFSDNWIPFGGAVFDVVDNYVWRAYSDISSSALFTAHTVTTFYESVDMTAMASVSSSPSRVAYAGANLSALADVITPNLRGLYSAAATFSADGVSIVSPSPVIHADGGYVYFDTSAVLPPVVGSILIAASVDMLSSGTIQANPAVWTQHYDSPNLSADASVYAFASVWGFDITIFTRGAETKDFVRAADVKDFTKVPT